MGLTSPTAGWCGPVLVAPALQLSCFLSNRSENHLWARWVDYLPLAPSFPIHFISFGQSCPVSGRFVAGPFLLRCPSEVSICHRFCGVTLLLAFTRSQGLNKPATITLHFRKNLDECKLRLALARQRGVHVTALISSLRFCHCVVIVLGLPFGAF